jgi:hypothetical protein
MKSVSYIRPKNYDTTWKPLLKRVNQMLGLDMYTLMVTDMELAVTEVVEDQIPDLIWQDLKDETGLVVLDVERTS